MEMPHRQIAVIRDGLTRLIRLDGNLEREVENRHRLQNRILLDFLNGWK
jgi:hypothetical protein